MRSLYSKMLSIFGVLIIPGEFLPLHDHHNPEYEIPLILCCGVKGTDEHSPLPPFLPSSLPPFLPSFLPSFSPTLSGTVVDILHGIKASCSANTPPPFRLPSASLPPPALLPLPSPLPHPTHFLPTVYRTTYFSCLASITNPLTPPSTHSTLHPPPSTYPLSWSQQGTCTIHHHLRHSPLLISILVTPSTSTGCLAILSKLAVERLLEHCHTHTLLVLSNATTVPQWNVCQEVNPVNREPWLCVVAMELFRDRIQVGLTSPTSPELRITLLAQFGHPELE
ncbi:unnamed protein product [Taenia asiatica]|uniref:Uncharacterized protein n=1 Tax=Taenia asiatica TaxID=60517 RepID=A0A158R895_TAEAS|nr:unnamed protein product [Taenia asiatica]